MADLTHEETQAAARGEQAAYELRETEAAFAEVRAGLFEVIATSALGEQQLREKCFLAVQSLDQVKSVLMKVASSKDIVNHTALIRSILAGEDEAPE